MNIFLPYENDIVKSVQSLDDVRLQKQAVEILNYIRNKKDSDGEYVMDPEQYLMLLEFIVDIIYCVKR